MGARNSVFEENEWLRPSSNSEPLWSMGETKRLRQQNDLFAGVAEWGFDGEEVRLRDASWHISLRGQ